MQNQNYVFRFHNSNSVEYTASFFLKTAINANVKKIEEEILHTMASQEKIKSAKKSAFISASV